MAERIVTDVNLQANLREQVGTELVSKKNCELESREAISLLNQDEQERFLQWKRVLLMMNTTHLMARVGQ